MTSALPSRRFREARLLIGAALLTLVAMVAVEMGGVLGVADLVTEETRRSALSAAQLLASQHSRGEAPRFLAALRTEGWGLAVFRGAVVQWTEGEVGPLTSAWWPWRTREDWEANGSQVAGPLQHANRQVVVAYQILGDGRHVRVVVPAARARAAGRWRTAGAALALVVGLGGATLAWVLITRALGPYRELLAEAERVTKGPGQGPEDRFLVDTFREAVRRLEMSEAGARQRVDELEVLTQVLTREASFGVVIVDASERVQATNPPARELLGPELAPGSPLPPALTSDGRLSFAGRVLEVRRFPLLSSSGTSLGHVVFFSDRTSLEALERALGEREQMAQLGELAAGMAHELRNALATIRGYMRLLPEADEARRARFLAAMEQEASELERLLHRFLGFAQPHELQQEACDLQELIRDAVGRVQAAFASFRLTLDLEPCPLDLDRMAVSVIIENLLRNAAEAVGSGGSVAVRMVVADTWVRVAIEDDGPGVSAEVLDRLFSPFVSTKPSGGLGLAMSRRFARLHGGDVTHEPRPGGGSRFVLALPRGSTP